MLWSLRLIVSFPRSDITQGIWAFHCLGWNTGVASYSFGSTRGQDGSIINQMRRDGQIYTSHGRVDYAFLGNSRFSLPSKAIGESFAELRIVAEF